MSTLKLKSADGFELDALEALGGPGAPGVVFAHGMCVDKDGEGIFVRAFDELARLGYSVLRFDFRAHGKSQGQARRDFNVRGELKDLEAALNHLRSRGTSRLGLAGASFGGGIAALAAGGGVPGLEAVFLANPLLDYGGLIEPELPWPKSVYAGWQDELKANGFVSLKADWTKLELGPSFFEDMRAYHPARALAAYRGALMAVHGDKDEMVGLEATRRAFDSVPNPLKRFETIKNSGHGFHEEPHETVATALCAGFFREHLRLP